MRLVRLKKVGDAPFWIMHCIRLYEGHEFSPLLDIDKLNEKQKEVIDHSVRINEIALYNVRGDRIDGGLEMVNIIHGMVSTDDIDDDEEDILPEIASVTVDTEELDMNAVEKTIAITAECQQEAQWLIAKNGNTIKKVLSELAISDYNLMLLYACLDIENNDKNRPGVLAALEKNIQEHIDG